MEKCPITKSECLKEGCEYYLDWKPIENKCYLILADNNGIVVVDNAKMIGLKNLKRRWEKSKHLIEALNL